MIIILLLSLKASVYSFVDEQLIFLKFEQSNTNTSVSSERTLTTACFFLIYDWAELLRDYIISFIITRDALRDFVSFVQFLKSKKHPWRSVTLVKLQTFSLQLCGLLACNFTKSNTPPWVFFTFFKLYKWYQNAQNIIIWN